ncbi:phage holin [Paraclostridium bifermentans]|uniref:phage holin n=1 Tax=Paraclostridium bifermentans TaxID=1490 RepID=UPI0018A9CA14|nr:phage holin [Paraclostridium bifermentans]
MKKRFKNPYFWLGLGGVIFSSSGVDFNTLTSWNLLGEALSSILSNPVAVVAVIAALIGVCVDPSTRGLKDTK